jgi:hypothetical protein
MNPTLLLLGLVVGLLTFRLPIILLAIVGFSLLWAALVAASNGLGDFPLACAVSAANATIGVALGVTVSLLIQGGFRNRPTT